MQTVPQDDYYALLGVKVDADDAEQRSAWRKDALQWHPDRAGGDSTAAFQSIAAANAVLSDPISRAACNRRRRVTARSAETWSDATNSPVTKPPRKKALGVVLRRLTGPLDALIAFGITRRTEGEAIESVLNANEAAEGWLVTISVRVAMRCSCIGSSGACAKCGGRGSADELFSAWLAVSEGLVLAPSAQLHGLLMPVVFRMRVGA